MKAALSTGMALVSLNRVGGAMLPRRSVLDGRSLNPDDPAVYAITDFNRDPPVTVDSEQQIDDALNDMIHLGVRALLVQKDQRLAGLITSYDIQGEKPIQFLQSSTYTLHRDIRVTHIMTPGDQLLALDWEGVEVARAPDLLRVFDETGLDSFVDHRDTEGRLDPRGARSGVACAVAASTEGPSPYRFDRPFNS